MMSSRANMFFSLKYFIVLAVIQIVDFQNGLNQDQFKDSRLHVRRRKASHTSQQSFTTPTLPFSYPYQNGDEKSKTESKYDIRLQSHSGEGTTQMDDLSPQALYNVDQSTITLDITQGDSLLGTYMHSSTGTLELDKSKYTSNQDDAMTENGKGTKDPHFSQTPPTVSPRAFTDATLSRTPPRCENPDSLDWNIINDTVTDCVTKYPEIYSCIDYCGNSRFTCSCDTYCKLYGDCCEDFAEQCPNEDQKSKYISKHFYVKPECRLNVKMVMTCNDNNNTACPTSSAMLDNIPVQYSGVTFLNKKCAECNGNSFSGNLTYWPTKLRCDNMEKYSLETFARLQDLYENGTCKLILLEPDEIHRCSPIVSTCDVHCMSKDLRQMCEKDKPAYMYRNNGTTYWNVYCAICANDWQLDTEIQNYECYSPLIPELDWEYTIDIWKFSFALLMNINPNDDIHLGFDIDGRKQDVKCTSVGCKHVCDVNFELKNNMCVRVHFPFMVDISYDMKNLSSHAVTSCPVGEDGTMETYHHDLSTCMEQILANRHPDRSNPYIDQRNGATFTYTNKFDNVLHNGTVTVEYTMKLEDEQNMTNYEIHNETFKIVLNMSKTCYQRTNAECDSSESLSFMFSSIMFQMMGICTQYDWESTTVFSQLVCDDYIKVQITQNDGVDSNDIRGYLSICCLVLSIVSMFFRISLQPFIKAFHSFSGKIQFCLVVSLFFSHILYLCGSLSQGERIICKVMGILIHYAFLCGFTWMTLIALDMYRTFRLPVQIQPKGWAKLLRYCLAAFLIPAFVVSISVIVDSVPIDTMFKPMYGSQLCQISNPNANWLFFAGPIACVLLINTTLYILTVLSLRKSWRQTKIAAKTQDYHIYIYIKLFIIMGFTWVCGFIGPFTHEAFSYLFILLNASQGVFISVSSLCSKQVQRELKCCRRGQECSAGATNTHAVTTAL